MKEPTGRRRCRIPEHRKQIKAMQKWCAFLETTHRAMWAERMNDRLQQEVWRLKVARFERALTEIATGTKAWTRDQMIDCATEALCMGTDADAGKTKAQAS